MTDAGYGITLFDPMARPVNYIEIPDSYTTAYFVERFREMWPNGILRSDPSDGRSLHWTIPELDSADPDNDFAGIFSYEDKGIAFDLVPHATVVEFVHWIRSIVPPGHSVYLVKIPDLQEEIEVLQTTSDEELLEFLAFRENRLGNAPQE